MKCKFQKTGRDSFNKNVSCVHTLNSLRVAEESSYVLDFTGSPLSVFIVATFFSTSTKHVNMAFFAAFYLKSNSFNCWFFILYQINSSGMRSLPDSKLSSVERRSLSSATLAICECILTSIRGAGTPVDHHTDPILGHELDTPELSRHET